MTDGFDYTTLLAERNAADAIPWVLLEARPQFENTTIADGMERFRASSPPASSLPTEECFSDIVCSGSIVQPVAPTRSDSTSTEDPA